jgi:hypothetical protein
MRKNRLAIWSQGVCGGKIFVRQPGTIEATWESAKKKPINAKGMAKMVCENLISER